MPDCVVPGCARAANNTLGLRLPKPTTEAIWSPNLNAYVCDVHARSGARVTVMYEATDSGRVETRVQGVTGPTVRRTSIH